MAKARSRTAARKVKDRWKAKNWYKIQAPPAFDNVTIADTLTENPDSLINRVTGVSLQDLTNDFRKSHMTLYFKVNKVEDNNALTQFEGHTLTSDYLRRMVRRRKSKVDGVYDVKTRDGATIRVKPFATTDKRIQNSQKKVIRESMKKTIESEASKSTMSEFVRSILDGKIGSEIYKHCKILYPVKRIEIFKTQVVNQPTIIIEDKKPEVKPEETKDTDKKEKKTTKKAKKEEEVKEPVNTEDIPKEEEKSEEKTEDIKEKQVKEDKPEKEIKEDKKDTKIKEKKAPAKKTTTKKAAVKKPAAKKTPAKKQAAKKTAAKKKATKKE